MNELFLQVDLQMLAEFGLPPRLLMLYGRLRLHAGKDGKCFVRHEKLAEEIGLHGKYRDRQVRKLLNQLRQLRLISWRRGRYCNYFDVHDPDRNWISGQTGTGVPLSDRNWSSDRKDVSSSKEESKRGPLPPTPSPQGEGERPRPKSPRKPEGPRREQPAEKTKTQEFQKVDDDENPKPRPLASSPEAEFRQRLIERHGPLFDAEGCMKHVRKQLEKTGGLSLADFLAFDTARTTAPSALKNPGGYYVGLAKELRNAAVAAAFDAATTPLRQAAAPPEPPRDDKGRCIDCGGPGVLKDGSYCTCQMGRDLKDLERRTAQSETTKKKPPVAAGGEEKPNVVSIKSRRQ